MLLNKTPQAQKMLLFQESNLWIQILRFLFLKEFKKLATIERSGYQMIHDIVRVGFLRAASIIIYMFFLQSVAASFTQVAKSAQPLFTVVISFIILEHISLFFSYYYLY